VSRIFLKENVLVAARQRVARLFDDFEHIVVNVSGGKDSTIILNLALEEAATRDRLPLPVFFLDQEAEWACVIDHIREIMYDPRVKPYWLQVPFRLFNAASADDPWLYCWRPGDEWMHPQDPISLKENVYGADRFYPIFDAAAQYHWPTGKVAFLYGLRAEESPARFKAMTAHPVYQDITWGGVKAGKPKGRMCIFSPIYDWSTTDVWKAIADHDWPYCRLYDLMYAHNLPVRTMRVSSVIHEQALFSLQFMQEIEPETWNALMRRLHGIHSVRHFADEGGRAQLYDLPWMFADWRDYRDYLLEHLITDESQRELFRVQFRRVDKLFADAGMDGLWAWQVFALVANDHWMSAINTVIAASRQQLRQSAKGATGDKYSRHPRSVVPATTRAL
jgi:predicted phosphoadenosine phosphosulfate sulfurtransferase